MKLNPFAIMKEEFDGTGLIYHPESNKALTLNKSGVVLWKVFASGGTAEAGVDAILDQFKGVTREQAAADVEKFINKLQEWGLLSQ